MAQTQVILLERVENLGQMGEIVTVKPGYARNFLLPQSKAMRASKSNIAYFEAQKKQLEATNLAKKSEAEKLAAKLKDFSVVIIRQAAEGGQLYGSVTTRDIAEAAQTAGVTLDRSQVRLNMAFKTLGLFTLDVYLHAEVKIPVVVNIARSDEEAKMQKKLGKAVIAGDNANAAVAAAAPATEKSAFLDQEALTAEAKAQAEAAAQAEMDAKTAAEKSAKRAAKKATKKTDEPAAEGEAEGTSEEAE